MKLYAACIHTRSSLAQQRVVSEDTEIDHLNKIDLHRVAKCGSKNFIAKI